MRVPTPQHDFNEPNRLFPKAAMLMQRLPMRRCAKHGWSAAAPVRSYANASAGRNVVARLNYEALHVLRHVIPTSGPTWPMFARPVCRFPSGLAQTVARFFTPTTWTFWHLEFVVVGCRL